MVKPKIILTSVLKPVDDTRMFEKFGISLSQTSKYDINIIGFCPKNLPSGTDITFHPIFKFNRLSFKRLIAPWKAFKLYIKLKPQVIIVNTHELLIVSLLYKIIFGTKLLYDVQENYYRNILHTNAFPFLLRPFIAAYVRAKEYFSTLFVDHYFLAEKHYEEEFTFTKNKCSVIENKFKPRFQVDRLHGRSDKITLLFTGTIAESTGIFEAIKLAKGLHQLDPKVELNIYGHCAHKQTLDKLKKEIEPFDFIHLTGGENLVTHKEILTAIAQADFGIICYPENPSTSHSIPTKLYEYLGIELPILLQNHPVWVELATRHDGCIVVNFEEPDLKNLLQLMKTKQFYRNSKKQELLWENEEQRLLQTIDKLIS